MYIYLLYIIEKSRQIPTSSTLSYVLNDNKMDLKTLRLQDHEQPKHASVRDSGFVPKIPGIQTSIATPVFFPMKVSY